MPDNAIWAVTGPEHDARMARELAWIATGGQTGIVGPESLEVLAQNTPNNTVRIMPGGFSISATSERANIGYTSAPWQSYMRAVYQPIDVEIDATGSSGGRTDVVGIVVDDPEFEGTSPDPDAHQYWRAHVVKNAGNNATRPEHFASLGRPFLPLAQVRIPSSTATITDSMITDLRVTSVSRSHIVPLVQDASPDGNSITIGPDQTSWMDLPNFTNIQVPSWASHATIMLSLTSAHAAGGSAMGQYRIALTGTNGTWMGSGTSFLEDSGLWTRFDLHGAGTYPLHTSSRGGAVTVRPQVRRTSTSSHTGDIVIPDVNVTRAQLFGSITFEESARYDREGA